MSADSKTEPGLRSYRFVYVKGVGLKHLHRIRAERALGKPLPPGAIVHHADGKMRDDSPLVICQDHAYHNSLHARMRIVAAGGDPDRDARCGACGKAKDRSLFVVCRLNKTTGVARRCLQCHVAGNALRREMRRQEQCRSAVLKATDGAFVMPQVRR